MCVSVRVCTPMVLVHLYGSAHMRFLCAYVCVLLGESCLYVWKARPVGITDCRYIIFRFVHMRLRMHTTVAKLVITCVQVTSLAKYAICSSNMGNVWTACGAITF